MNTPKLRKARKRSFAMAEVCVAVGIVGIATAYLFSSVYTSIRQYTMLRDEICCSELADEVLARSVAQFLIDPPDFDTATSPDALSQSTDVGAYTVSLKVYSQRKEADEEERPPTMEKDPIALIEFIVIAQRSGSKEGSGRSIQLCVCKEGA